MAKNRAIRKSNGLQMMLDGYNSLTDEEWNLFAKAGRKVDIDPRAVFTALSIAVDGSFDDYEDVNYNDYEASTKKSKMKKSTSDPLNDKIGQTIFFHGREYEITDIDMVGSDKNDKGEFGLLFDVYLMDARNTTYSVTILVPREKEDEAYSSDEWTDYIFARRGDVTVTHPEDWAVQNYYYEHYGIEPHFKEMFDIDTIKSALNVPEECITSIRQVSEDKIQVEFDDVDWYYEHIPDNALYHAGYFCEWYDSYILDIYPNDDSYRKSTKKSTQKPINKTMSFEDNVNKLRKSNYDRTGNINTIIKERR